MKTVDLLLKDGRIIDVLYGEISPPTSVAIDNWEIAGIGGSYKAKQEIDVRGKFLAPGFIDSHIHLESSELVPIYFIKAVVSHGTTGIIHDPHEIANIGGLYGLTVLHAGTECLPCKIYMTVPSSVPITPPEMGLETSGSHIGIKETELLMDSPEVVGLGEVMNIPGVLNREENIMKKIEIAKKHDKIVEGHAPRLTGDVLKRYIDAGIESDHEVTSFEEAKERNERGMWVYIREGSASRDEEKIIPGYVKKGENTDKLAFCVDDLNTHDLIRGHIDHCIRKAIKLGMDPVEAFRIASHNACRRFKKEKICGAIKEGYFANLVVISAPGNSPENLDKFKICKTFYSGRIVFNEGELCDQLKNYPEEKYDLKILNSVSLAKKYEPKDFTINLGPKYASKEVQVRVIQVKDGTIETKELLERMYADKYGVLDPDPEKDISEAFVVGRHAASKGNVGRGFIKGIGIKKKTPYAISSSIGHDDHNILVTGTNSRDRSVAVNRQQHIGGGIVLVENGIVTREISLRYFGLMSIKPAEQVYNEQQMFNERLYEMGSKLKSPATTLSFVPLTVIPELRLTDKGLVKNYKIVPLIVENQNN
jgi:adenine deaminase